MIINAVGCPYSGLEIMSEFAKVFGIRFRENDYGMGYERRVVQRKIPYDCNEFPEWVNKWISETENQGLNDYMKLDGHFIHVSWIRSLMMYALSKTYPEVQFLIILRNPEDIIGAWFNIIGTTGPEVTIRSYVQTVLNIYHFLWEQADLMEKKPIVMDYDKFIQGEYIKEIFNMFDIENSLENYHTAQSVIQKNRLKNYTSEKIDVDQIKYFEHKLRQL